MQTIMLTLATVLQWVRQQSNKHSINKSINQLTFNHWLADLTRPWPKITLPNLLLFPAKSCSTNGLTLKAPLPNKHAAFWTRNGASHFLPLHLSLMVVPEAHPTPPASCCCCRCCLAHQVKQLQAACHPQSQQ